MWNYFNPLFGQNNSKELQEAFQKNAVLVDVRTPEEFSEGSVKGAINIPLDKIDKNLDFFKDKKTVIVFCKSGGRSSQAKSILDQDKNLEVINGGSWQNVQKVLEEFLSQKK